MSLEFKKIKLQLLVDPIKHPPPLVKKYHEIICLTSFWGTSKNMCLDLKECADPS